MLKMNDDQLIDRLNALCKRFAKTALDGRYTVAERAHLSEQYLYQVITGKPMANGNKRSIGKIARSKLSSAFPDWLDRSDAPAEATHRATEPTPPAYKRPHHSRDLVQKVCDLAEQINDDGLRELAGFARCLTGTHPFKKPARAKPKKAA